MEKIYLKTKKNTTMHLTFNQMTYKFLVSPIMSGAHIFLYLDNKVDQPVTIRLKFPTFEFMLPNTLDYDLKKKIIRKLSDVNTGLSIDLGYFKNIKYFLKPFLQQQIDGILNFNVFSKDNVIFRIRENEKSEHIKSIRNQASSDRDIRRMAKEGETDRLNIAVEINAAVEKRRLETAEKRKAAYAEIEATEREERQKRYHENQEEWAKNHREFEQANRRRYYNYYPWYEIESNIYKSKEEKARELERKRKKQAEKMAKKMAQIKKERELWQEENRRQARIKAEKERKIKEEYIKTVYENYNGKCAVCDHDDEENLRVTLIKKPYNLTKEEKIRVENSILLCTAHQRIFNKHLISFDMFGRIQITGNPKSYDKVENISPEIKINATDAMKPYLIKHNQEFLNSQLEYYRYRESDDSSIFILPYFRI